MLYAAPLEFVNARTLHCVADVAIAPDCKEHRWVTPIVNGEEVLNGSSLIDPSAPDDILNAWWPDEIVRKPAIRVVGCGDKIAWMPWIDEPLMLSFVHWTTIAFDRQRYEDVFGGTTRFLTPLSQRECAFAAGLIADSLRLPDQDECQYCIPSVLGDPSGQQFFSVLRRGLFTESDHFQVRDITQTSGALIIGFADDELVLEWGCDEGQRYVRFASPMCIPLWITSPAINHALGGIDS